MEQVVFREGIPVKYHADIAGCQNRTHPVSGAYYKLSCEIRGSGNLDGMYFSKILRRKNMKRIRLNDQWKKIGIPVFLPSGKNQALSIVFFFWKQPEAKAEIRDLKIETR